MFVKGGGNTIWQLFFHKENYFCDLLFTFLLSKDKMLAMGTNRNKLIVTELSLLKYFIIQIAVTGQANTSSQVLGRANDTLEDKLYKE